MFSRYFVIILIICSLHYVTSKRNPSSSVVDNVADIKDFKKLLRTKTNVLVLFSQSSQDGRKMLDLFYEAAEIIKGQGTLVYVECTGEAKKLCKKLKINPQPIILKHFKDGEFHKDYDRKDTIQSLVNFMRDPTGDIPWEEELVNGDLIHVPDAVSLGKIFKKESKPVLVMFYAPWCGFCKRLKPVYAEVATELKGHSILVAMDANKPENSGIRQHFNITGFPTLLYFQEGKFKYRYEGENTKEGILGFMKNPTQPPVKPKEEEWADTPSEVVHLTDATFDVVLPTQPSALIMFYAPWCGHCKSMKPEYVDAAFKLKTESVQGILAAVDATKEKKLGAKFDIKGYPTVKYFKNGEFAFDVSFRTADKIIEFMKDPKEPPPPPPPEKPWHEADTDVVHLDEETFKPFLKKKKHALVMFYAPWCGHCKKAKPEYENAAATLKNDVSFAAVDCTIYNSLCSSQEVQGYPTFKYFSYFKNVSIYEGDKTEMGFVNFMKTPQKPTVAHSQSSPLEEWKGLEGAEDLHHLNEKSFSNFIQEHDSVLIMFYAPWCGHCKAMKPAYAQAATALKEQKISGVLATVDATVERGLQSKYGIKGYPTLKYFRNGVEVGDFDRDRTIKELVSFMKTPPTGSKKKDEL